LEYPIHCDIVYFDYVQRSCSSLYRLLRFTNCPSYITLHYITLHYYNYIKPPLIQHYCWLCAPYISLYY